MPFEVHILPVLHDNYIFIIHCAEKTAVVDPAVSEPVIELLSKKGWSLDLILNTHHHADHIGANLDLKQQYNCKIIGSVHDQSRIPGIDETVDEGDSVEVGEAKADVLFVPGHTRGHIAFFFAQQAALFCGDTLFAMGCGRLFEGTPKQMWQSLQKLAGLPGDTKVYCAHEYTMANGEFALSVEPNNDDLKTRMENVIALRTQGTSTIPSTIKSERETNPFIRAGSADNFAKIRKLKDNF